VPRTLQQAALDLGMWRACLITCHTLRSSAAAALLSPSAHRFQTPLIPPSYSSGSSPARADVPTLWCSPPTEDPPAFPLLPPPLPATPLPSLKWQQSDPHRVGDTHDDSMRVDPVLLSNFTPLSTHIPTQPSSPLPLPPPPFHPTLHLRGCSPTHATHMMTACV
jgi:hypothetical protein